MLDANGQERLMIGLKTGDALQITVAMPGDLAWFPSNAIPAGWVLADGAFYTPSAQPALFEAIGYRFGQSGTRFKVMEVVDFLRPAAGPSDGTMLTLVSDDVRNHGHPGGLSGSGGSHNHTITFPSWITITIVGIYSADQHGTNNQGYGGYGLMTIGAAGSHAHGVVASGGGGVETAPKHVTMALCVCAVGHNLGYLA